MRIGSLRSKMLVGALALCCAGTTLVFTRHADSATRHHHARPNIVLLLTDDQRFDTLWSMPHVRKLIAQHGVTFTNGFVVNSLCCPSRSSILTGQYSHGTGVYKNDPPYGGFSSFNDRSTIATWLHHAGYHNALVGKYLNGYGEGPRYIPPGWDSWYALLAPNGYYNYFVQTRKRQLAFGDEPEDYSTDVFANAAVKFIRQTKSPFFLYFAPYSPHLPAEPAPRDAHAFGKLPPFSHPSFDEADVSDKPQYVQDVPPFVAGDRQWALHVRRAQLQTLKAADRAVGRIIGALTKKGILHRTMIVFMSDNGLMWGEHRLTGVKEMPYEESIRVPLVIRYDPITKRARTDKHFALNIDLAPTFAALAGVKAPNVDGHSLLPVLRRRAKTWRTDFLVEHLYGDHPPPTYCEVRGARYMYTLYSTGEEELYDMSKDPYQLSNLASDPSMERIKLAMHQRLIQLCSPPPPGYDPVMGPPPPTPSPSPSPSSSPMP